MAPFVPLFNRDVSVLCTPIVISALKARGYRVREDVSRGTLVDVHIGGMVRPRSSLQQPTRCIKPAELADALSRPTTTRITGFTRYSAVPRAAGIAFGCTLLTYPRLREIVAASDRTIRSPRVKRKQTVLTWRSRASIISVRIDRNGGVTRLTYSGIPFGPTEPRSGVVALAKGHNLRP